MADKLFTPFLARGSTVRAHMELAHEDYEKFKALERGQSVKVTDQLSGEQLLVAKMSCGLGCYCAAVIISPIRW